MEMGKAGHTETMGQETPIFCRFSDWPRTLAAEALCSPHMDLEALNGARIIATGLADDLPYLDCQRPDGQNLRAWILADPEGNGPGFLFGLPLPSSTTVKALQQVVAERPGLRSTLDYLWSLEYYSAAEDLVIVSTTGESPEGFPEITCRRPGVEELIYLELSADTEGNCPGHISVEPKA